MQNKSKKNKVLLVSIITLLVIIIGIFFTTRISSSVVLNGHIKEAHLYYNEQAYEEAVIEYQAVLAIDEKNVKARVGLGKTYLALDDVDNAREVLVTGTELTPKEPELYVELSEVELYEDNVIEAAATLDKGYEQTKDKEISNKLEQIKKQITITAEHEFIQVGFETTLLVQYSDGEKVTELEGKWEAEPGTFGELTEVSASEAIVKGLKAGTETISITLGTITKQIDIVVKDQVATRFNVEQLFIELYENQTVTLKTLAKDMNDKEMKADATWKIKKGNGSLDKTSGDEVEFTSEQAGNVTVTTELDGLQSDILLIVQEEEYRAKKIKELSRHYLNEFTRLEEEMLQGQQGQYASSVSDPNADELDIVMYAIFLNEWNKLSTDVLDHLEEVLPTEEFIAVNEEQEEWSKRTGDELFGTDPDNIPGNRRTLHALFTKASADRTKFLINNYLKTD